LDMVAQAIDDLGLLMTRSQQDDAAAQ
jgi:hypothetical protein